MRHVVATQQSVSSRVRAIAPKRGLRAALSKTAGMRLACLLLLLFGARAGAAQQPVPGQKGEAPLSAVVDFMELAAREAAAPAKKPEQRVVPFMPRPPRPGASAGAPTPEKAEAPAPSRAPGPPLAPSPAPSANFQALGDDDTSIPPDTHGAVGPNHLMVTLNSQVEIQDKMGNVLSTVTLDSFWASTGATGVFDPRVVYDPFANRWIFTSASGAMTATSMLLIGASQTSNPTGKFNLYSVRVDKTGTNWGDYPSTGFNKDWVGVTVNLFGVSAPGNFASENIYVFNKANLYAGAMTASFTLFNDVNAFAQQPAFVYDKTLATMHLVEDWNGTAGQLRISTVTGPVGSETYTPGTAFPTASGSSTWASGPPAGADFAPQKGSLMKIQNGDSRLLKALYRNGSLWAAQNAFLPTMTPTRTAAQWWQFLPDGTLQQFGRVDDSTGTIFYAYPTIAVNAQNDAVLGYSSFSASQFASANYSVRFASDPANTLRSDALLKAGEAAYFKTFGGSQNRWGDYSNTVVDPVNDLDIWTIQEYASSPNFPSGDNRWGTWWGKFVLPKKRLAQLVSQ